MEMWVGITLSAWNIPSLQTNKCTSLLSSKCGCLKAEIGIRGVGGCGRVSTAWSLMYSESYLDGHNLLAYLARIFLEQLFIMQISDGVWNWASRVAQTIFLP